MLVHITDIAYKYYRLLDYICFRFVLGPVLNHPSGVIVSAVACGLFK